MTEGAPLSGVLESQCTIPLNNDTCRSYAPIDELLNDHNDKLRLYGSRLNAPVDELLNHHNDKLRLHGSY